MVRGCHSILFWKKTRSDLAPSVQTENAELRRQLTDVTRQSSRADKLEMETEALMRERSSLQSQIQDLESSLLVEQDKVAALQREVITTKDELQKVHC